tara:strand:- start:1941 stop:2393 length:453 start_codon:yes stop_codon:yes gene_type:complete
MQLIILVMMFSMKVLQAQIGGNLAEGPPVELALNIATMSGEPTISVSQFELVTGEYYRLNVTSDGDETWRFEADELLQNSHLRVVTINEIEVHLQSLAFRAIEFDVAGTAQFSFAPVRPGTYTFSVGDTPSTTRRRADGGRMVTGQFIVK